MDKQKFGQVVKMLFNSKGKQWTMDTIESWWFLLKDYPEDKVILAIVDLAKSSAEFFNAGMVIERITPNKEATVEQAWESCYASAERGGRVSITNREAKALNSIGGMMKLRDCELNDMHWLRKDFIEAYLNLPANSPTIDNCPGLEAKILTDKGAMAELSTSEPLKQMLGKIGMQI